MRPSPKTILLGTILLITAGSGVYFAKQAEPHRVQTVTAAKTAAPTQLSAPTRQGAQPPRTQANTGRTTGATAYSTRQLPLREQTEDGKLFTISPDALGLFENLKVGDAFSWRIGQGYTITGIVDAVHRSDQSASFGVTLDHNAGRMAFQKNATREIAQLFFNGQRTAHRIEHGASGWQLLETTVAELRCASSMASYPVAAAYAFPRKATASTNTLSSSQQSTLQTASAPAPFQSRPGAPTVIYCDFDGEVVNQSDWSDSTINAAASGFSDADIATILEIVAEDYAPFDVNVTNVRSVFDNTASNQRVMCISTPTDTAEPGSGGVAYLDSFVDDLVCWNFNLTDPWTAADTISHETGHTFNLEHDGDSNNEYYSGHAADGGEFWGPIMGAAFDATITQWSKGAYYQASNTEDDLALITSHGLAFRSDDYGDHSNAAYPLTVNEQAVSIDGVIGRSTDIDVFAVHLTSLGTLQLRGAVDGHTTDLDLRIRVYDADDALLIDYTSDLHKDVIFESSIQPGDYEIWIQGDSSGSPTSNPPTGWTNDGSLGNYSLILSPNSSQAAAIDHYAAASDGGDADWFYQTEVTHDGQDALQAGLINNSATSILSITKRSTSVRFWLKVSSEAGYDFLQFRIDGTLQEEWSGEQGWIQFTRTGLSDSQHTFEWRYEKDNSVSSGSDTAWIDQVEFDDYSAWASTNDASTDGTTDTNGNGTPDLIDYGLVAHASAGISQGQAVVIPDSRALNFYIDPTHSDIVIRIQTSDALQTWEDVAVSYGSGDFFTKTGVTVTETAVDSQTSKISLSLDSGSDTKKFARILVSKD